MTTELRIIPIPIDHEFCEGDRIAEHLHRAAIANAAPIESGDVVVVTQKIVSKVEGRVRPIHAHTKAELIAEESRRILRTRNEMSISETHHGFVCANAGIDFSNMPDGTVALLPVDPDRSAQRIHDEFKARFDCAVGVIISDTFGRPWRRGLVDVALGVAGMAALLDLRGEVDALGRVLEVTEIAVADELSAAAELVMGKSAGIPAAIIRGVSPQWLGIDGRAVRDLVRPVDDDFFR